MLREYVFRWETADDSGEVSEVEHSQSIAIAQARCDLRHLIDLGQLVDVRLVAVRTPVLDAA